MKGKITAAQLIFQLRQRYDGRAYAFLEQVRGGTGMYGSRYCDALVMSLWPSRGFDVVGFEVKVSRSDWLCELKQPEKADEVFRFCNEWWLAAPAGMVHEGELPKTWGLLALEGGELSVSVPAPPLTPQPLTPTFVASVLRCVSKAEPGKERLQEQFDAGTAQGRKSEREARKQCTVAEAAEYQRIRKSLIDFEAASGVKIEDWNGGIIGEEFNAFLAATRTLRSMRNSIESIHRAASIILTEAASVKGTL